MKKIHNTPKLFISSFSMSFKSAAGALLLAVAGAQVASADVSTLNFDGGDGSSTFDQYTGVAGSGWSTAWTTVTNSAAAGSDAGDTGVTSDSPLYSGGGDYLQAGFNTPSDLTGTPAWSYSRQLDSSSINLFSTVTYNFYFRTDSSISDAGYQIFSRNADSASVGTSSSDTWEIFSDSDSWKLRSGDLQVDTNVLINAGEVYEFSIVSDPTTQTWTVTIAGSGENSYTSDVLDYRSDTATSEGSFLEFAIQDKDAADADSVYFSLDKVSVSSIPEPMNSSMLLGLLALSALALRKRA
jgi:hypothetical protein